MDVNEVGKKMEMGLEKNQGVVGRWMGKKRRMKMLCVRQKIFGGGLWQTTTRGLRTTSFSRFLAKVRVADAGKLQKRKITVVQKPTQNEKVEEKKLPHSGFYVPDEGTPEYAQWEKEMLESLERLEKIKKGPEQFVINIKPHRFWFKD